MKCFESFWMSIVHTGSIENQRKTYLAEGLNDFFRYRIAYIYVCVLKAHFLLWIPSQGTRFRVSAFRCLSLVAGNKLRTLSAQLPDLKKQLRALKKLIPDL